MKKKQITLLLIVSVSSVWGIIFYQVFNSAASDALPVKSTSVINFESKDEDIYPLADTFKLALNYRDPFLEQNSGSLKQLSGDLVADEMSLVPREVPLSEPVSSPDVIEYKGYITNPQNKKVVSIITMNGKEQMLEEGQVISGIKLIKNYRDSVKISYQYKTRFLTLR